MKSVNKKLNNLVVTWSIAISMFFCVSKVNAQISKILVYPISPKDKISLNSKLKDSNAKECWSHMRVLDVERDNKSINYVVQVPYEFSVSWKILTDWKTNNIFRFQQTWREDIVNLFLKDCKCSSDWKEVLWRFDAIFEDYLNKNGNKAIEVVK